MDQYVDRNVTFTLFLILAGTYSSGFVFSLAKHADPSRGARVRLIFIWYLLLPIFGTYVVLMNAIKPIGSVSPSTYFTNVPTGNDWDFVAEVFWFWLDQFLATVCFGVLDEPSGWVHGC